MKKRFIIISLFLIVLVCGLSLASCGDKDAKADPASSADTAVITETEADETDPAGLVAKDVVEDGVAGKDYYAAGDVLVASERFDDEGRVISYTQYNSDGTQKSVRNNTYLTGDDPVQYTVTSYKYENGKCFEAVKTTFDEAGSVTGEFTFDGDGQLKEGYRYEYNEEGRCVKETRMDSRYVITMITENEYDAEGRINKIVYKTGTGSINSFSEYQYDESGNVARINNYDVDGNLMSYLEYVYDENGDLVETGEYVPDEDGSFFKLD